MEYSLSLTFTTELDKSKTLTFNGVKNDLTHENIEALMDIILANDIFVTGSEGAILAKKSYTFTERATTEFEVA